MNLIAEYIKRCLEKIGYSVPAVASSGEEAIKKTTEISKLVIMDIGLKGDMDGVQAAETIWNSSNSSSVFYWLCR